MWVPNNFSPYSASSSQCLWILGCWRLITVSGAEVEGESDAWSGLELACTSVLVTRAGRFKRHLGFSHQGINLSLYCFLGVWENQAGETNQLVHMNILITCVFAAFLVGALLAGFVVFCFRGSFLHKPRPQVHKDAETAPSCSNSAGSFVKLNGLFDSPVKVRP